MNPENAIEVRNMSKSFKVQYDKANSLKSLLIQHGRGKVQYHEVLKDINLDIRKGETVALIGTNGSGKSTLLKLMTKIIYPTKGTIETDGRLTSLLELGAGFHPDFTGRENIYFNAAIFGLDHKTIDQRIDEIIEFSELGSFIDEPIRTYSSGMYMRLAFSVAINVDADILLIDEILAVGDQHFQDKCFAKLRELRDSSKTIVIVSHSLDVVKDLCTRACWLYKGHFRLDGDPTYVITEYLKQVAIDHKEEKKQAVASGKAQYKGVIFIDTPQNYMHLSQNASGLGISGWEISDCEDGIFHLKAGQEELTDVKRVKRTDVYQIYQEDYGGFMDEDTIGFTVTLSREDCVRLSENGVLHVNAYVEAADGKKVTNKEVIVVVGEEQK